MSAPIEIFTGAAAQAEVAGYPANVLVYGGPGLGKTTDACAAFTTKEGVSTAFVIPCEHNALKAIPARGLPVPDHSGTVESWGQMEYVIGQLARVPGRYNAVIIDGLSALTANLYKEAEARKSSNKYDIPIFVRNCLFLLRQWTRLLGMHSVLLSHFKEPGVDNNVFYPGGPLLQPRTMIGVYFALVDTVLRVDYLNSSLPSGAPVRVYHTGGTIWPSEWLGPSYSPPADWRSWWVKNREGVTSAVVPADLGAFLRMKNPPYKF